MKSKNKCTGNNAFCIDGQSVIILLNDIIVAETLSTKSTVDLISHYYIYSIFIDQLLSGHRK